jgi:HSP20 family molecular chaperone IbpA
MQRVSASLIAGVLTVAVPKVQPETVPVTVEAVALPDDLPEPRGQVSLALPGLGAGDVTVSITRDRSLLLHVKGSNRVCGSVHEVLKLPDRAVAAEARASMVNGIFSFSVPIAAEVVSALTVAAEEEPAPMETADAEAGAHTDAKAVLLLEAAVPGLAASDFTAEARGRTLTISSTKAPATSKRQVRRSVLLPPHTRAPDDVHVSCVNGLLKVTATVHKPERLAITVSATEAAVLTNNAAAAAAAPVDAAPAIEAMQADGAEAEAAAGAQ